MVQLVQSCPCRGRIRAAEHDALRYEEQAAMTLMGKSDLESKEAAAMAFRRRASRAAGLAARLSVEAAPCSICGGAGWMTGNGSANYGIGANATMPAAGERVG